MAERVSEPFLTCEAALAEAAFHLGSAELVLGFVREGLVRPAFVVNEHLARLAELVSRYADRNPDLADLCLIRLSELHPAFPVITTDQRDFGVCRRGRREAIPLLPPPLSWRIRAPRGLPAQSANIRTRMEQPVQDQVAPQVRLQGVDVSLIRWFLSLTPAERLDFLQRHVNAIIAVRALNAGN